MSDTPLPPLDETVDVDQMTPPVTPEKRNPNMTTPFQIKTGQLGLSLTDPGVAVGAAGLTDYTDFSCTAVSVELVPSAGGNYEDVPRPFCGNTTPPVYVPNATQWAIEIQAFQDPQEAAGLAAFLIENDSGSTGEMAYFYVAGYDLADNGVKVIGSTEIRPGRLLGTNGNVLTTQMTWQVTGALEWEFASSKA